MVFMIFIDPNESPNLIEEPYKYLVSEHASDSIESARLRIHNHEDLTHPPGAQHCAVCAQYIAEFNSKDLDELTINWREPSESANDFVQRNDVFYVPWNP